MRCPTCNEETRELMCKECAKDAGGSNSAVMPGYDKAQAELRKLLVDAKKNRLDVDPREVDGRWTGYIQGIEGAIYRLEMHSVS